MPDVVSDDLPDPELYRDRCRACGTHVFDVVGAPIAGNADCFYLLEVMFDPDLPHRKVRGGKIHLCCDCYRRALAALGLDLDALIAQMLASRAS